MTGVWARTPLRIKLVAALCVLVTAGLTVAGIAASHALRSYLVNRIDAQLADVAGQSSHGSHGGPGGPPPSSDFDGDGSGSGGELTQFYVKNVNADGTLLSGGYKPYNESGSPRLPTLDDAAVSAHAGHPFTVGPGEGDDNWRVVVVPRRDGTGSVVVAESLAEVDSTVERLQTLELVIGVAVVVILGAIGYIVVRTSLRPLEEVEHTAAAIAGGDLSRRVPDASPQTEVGRLSQALNGMLAQLETAFRAQSESEATARGSEERMRRFVADASHELRTPLTSIRGFAELYRQGAVPDATAVTRVMRRIEDEAARMGLLVEDLLLLARLDEQRPLERIPVDVLTIASDAVTDARVIGPDHETTLEVHPGDVAPVVLGDEARLRQVVSNLVTNALTHTPPGIHVTVRVATETDSTGRWVVLDVADDGPGLPADAAERIFERFYRADPSRTRASGGTGLGLSIVAALVAAHGGTVDVTSLPGEGTTFRVRLPHVDTAAGTTAQPVSSKDDTRRL